MNRKVAVALFIVAIVAIIGINLALTIWAIDADIPMGLKLFILWR